MLSEYPKIDYAYDRIRLKKIFEHEAVAAFPNPGIQTEQSRSVFGELKFPPLPEKRAYTMASFVTSIDGKIAYLDNPAGPVIAQSNAMDPDGASADFWILNLMRASADAVLVGAVTMQKEPDGLVCLFDRGLEEARVQAGKPQAPLVVVCSLDGSDIPFADTLLANQPVMINTSPAGADTVRAGLRQKHVMIGPCRDSGAVDETAVKEAFRVLRPGTVPVLVTGEDRRPDAHAVLRILKLAGIDTALVESPSVCHSYLADGLLDEISLNYSCIYVGGTAVGLGNGMAPFTSLNHPHTEMLSIHMHSPSFFYFRHRFVYGKNPQGYLGTVY